MKKKIVRKCVCYIFKILNIYTPTHKDTEQLKGVLLYIV